MNFFRLVLQQYQDSVKAWRTIGVLNNAKALATASMENFCALQACLAFSLGNKFNDNYLLTSPETSKNKYKVTEAFKILNNKAKVIAVPLCNLRNAEPEQIEKLLAFSAVAAVDAQIDRSIISRSTMYYILVRYGLKAITPFIEAQDSSYAGVINEWVSVAADPDGLDILLVSILYFSSFDDGIFNKHKYDKLLRNSEVNQKICLNWRKIILFTELSQID